MRRIDDWHIREEYIVKTKTEKITSFKDETVKSETVVIEGARQIVKTAPTVKMYTIKAVKKNRRVTVRFDEEIDLEDFDVVMYFAKDFAKKINEV